MVAYYRWIIQDFYKLAQPIHHLKEQNREIKWTSECQVAFQKLKEYLCSPPILNYSDYSKPFLLDSDASDNGIRAVLSQLDDEGNGHVIAYASRLLSKPEHRYCVA